MDNSKLINLDITLAEIIRDHLIDFKNMDRAGVLYSKNNESLDETYDQTRDGDDTEWMLDELIWTFSLLAEGGALNDPSVQKKSSFKFNEEGVMSFEFDSEEGSKEDWLNEIGEVQARIDSGLILFAKMFQRLWD